MADCINKLKIVEEEINESIYWLELFSEVDGAHHTEIERLKQEAQELLSIMVASIKTSRNRQN